MPGLQPTNERADRIREFAASEMFARAFGEGMTLVEEVAAYLDTAGREESRALSRAGALAYAAESMRLTTRLMQVASWLLVQHSVRNGEMAPAEASEDKYRLRPETDSDVAIAGAEELPVRLRGLIARSRQIYDRAQRLDGDLYSGVEPANPVQVHIRQLRQAFSA